MPVSAYTYGPLERISKFVQRHPTGSVAAGVSAVLLAVGGLATSFMAQQAVISRMATRAGQADRAKAEDRAAASDIKARAAEASLNKGRSVAKVMRHAETELGPAVRAMQAVYFSTRPLPDLLAVRAEHEDRIIAFRDTERHDSASRATALAVLGWISVLSARGEDSLDLFRRSRESDSDVATGLVFEAMYWFTRYLDLMKIPSVDVGSMGFEFEEFPGEDPQMADIRAVIEKLAFEARECSVLGESASDDLVAVMEGIRALAVGDMAKAERGLAKALTMPELSWLHPQFRFARAICSYHRKDFSDAVRDIEIVLEALPDHLGALDHMGMCWIAHGITARLRGADPEPLLRRSIGYFSRGLKLESTSTRHRLGRAIALMTLGSHFDKTGRDPIPEFESALLDLDAAISWNPEIAEAWVCRGSVRARMAEALERVDLDTGLLSEKALEDCRRAVAMAPNHRNARSNLGNALARKAVALHARGEYARALDACNEALDAFGEVIAAGRGEVMARSNRGLALLVRARVAAASGADPVQDLGAAEADFTACIAANPRFADFHGSRALVRNEMAELMKGEQALDMLRKAEDDATEAVRLAPDSVMHLNYRGMVKADAARLIKGRGDDPVPLFTAAIADYDAALSRGPAHLPSLFNRAFAWRDLGYHLDETGGDPLAALEAALRDLERVIERGAKAEAVLYSIGNTAWRLGEAVAEAGKDPLGLYERAAEAFGTLNEMRPKNPDTLGNLANAIRSVGIALSGRGEDPSGHYRKAIACCDEALRVKAGHRLALSNRAAARVSLADHQDSTGADPMPELRAAIADFAEAVKAAGGADAKALMKIGLTRLRLAGAEKKRGSSGAQVEFNNAVEAFEHVIAVEPGNLQAHIYKASALGHAGRHAESVRAFETAARIAGDSKPEVLMWLNRARAIAAAGPWAADILDSDEHIRAGEYTAAGVLLSKGLDAARKDGAYAQPRFLPILIHGSYNLACVRAQASAGKTNPRGKPDPIAKDRAAELRAEAIGLLRAAMELGHDDVATVRADPDLEPLKGDPAFDALMAEWESRLKR